ncbi:biotin-dependent carboxyltransferase family protein [soil metagenome]
MKTLTILKPGLYTTIQDAGRYNFRKYGVPVSGAMDQWSAALANALLNKPAASALLEITLTGPTIKFNSDTLVALTGADISPIIDGKELQMNSTIKIHKGQILNFGKNKYGSRTYLAFKNELISEKVLKSQSLYPGITFQYRLQSGDTIRLSEKSGILISPSSHLKPHFEHFQTGILDVAKGPEYDYLSSSLQDQLKEIIFTVSTENNRMGYKLAGPPLQISKTASMITSSVLPGTVQLTPSGQLIILMRDCQTTGGYPRILQLYEKSINQLAQKKAGDKISFNISLR